MIEDSLELLRAEFPEEIDLLALHRRNPLRYPFLLESAAGHALAGRYDIALAFPGEAIETGSNFSAAQFFSELNRRHAAQRDDRDAELPFCGGWFLLLGYEAARGVEPSLVMPASPHALPDALAVRCTAAVIVDRIARRTVAMAECDAGQLAALQADCAAVLEQRMAYDEKIGRGPLLDAIDEESPERFVSGVGSILDYLRAGDVFQVNLSRRWQGRMHRDRNYLDVYAGLRRANPAPFAGLAHWRGTAVLSSSPERLLAIENGVAQTRPIAGTHARLADRAADLRQREQLMGNLKERAEHLMLIDLERNDLGRVCEAGSIEVSELMAIESYAHVHHIVSNVRGRLRAGVGPGAALRAVFPGGTITGCPKLRAMEIIAELEGVGRGPYTGAMGYLSRCGRLDTNILIRTLVCEGDRISFRAGAGIVADSNPQSELAETRAKARGLLAALGVSA